MSPQDADWRARRTKSDDSSGPSVEFSDEPFITKANCARVTGHDKFAGIIASVRKESAVTALSTGS